MGLVFLLLANSVLVVFFFFFSCDTVNTVISSYRITFGCKHFQSLDYCINQFWQYKNIH